MRFKLIFALMAAVTFGLLNSPCVGADDAKAATNDFAAVAELFAKHCLDCHAAQEPEGGLVMETFEALMKGGQSGAAIIPGKSADSLLMKMVEGRFEEGGKKKFMPPGKRKKLDAEEIALLKAWIDAGAQAPAGPARVAARDVVTPKIKPLAPPPRSILASAFAPSLKLLAVARHGEVELLSVESRMVQRTLSGHRGPVNAVAFSADGGRVVAGGGEAGLIGEVRVWNTSSGELIRTLEAHPDAIYAVAISPDGQTLATGSYDQKIKLWNLESGELLHTLSAHHGAVFDLAFRPDGKILASVSGDRTVKLWSTATGKRVETLSQSLKELYAVAFSPDGKRLVSAGVDNRLRLYEISEAAAETTNPLLESKFAHEGTILNVVWSADGKTLLSSAEDGTVKLWDAVTLVEQRALAKQPDLAPAIAFLAEDKSLAVGRLDGTLEIYDAKSGKAVPPAAPELTRAEPRGFQRGTTVTLKLSGKHLASVTNVTSTTPQLSGELLGAPKPEEANIKLAAAPELARGSYEIALNAANGSAKIKVHIDDLPAVYEGTAHGITNLPVSFWGALDQPGESDQFDFEAKAGETIVLDLAIRNLGSKITNGSVALLDRRGAVLATDSGFDGGDRYLAYRLPSDGRYTARVSDLMLGGSGDHFYRLSVGLLPFVSGIYPLSVSASNEAEVNLIGFNLPADAKVKLKTGAAGEMDVPVDSNRFRSERAFKVLVSESSTALEIEPNDQPAQAQIITVPSGVNGRIWNSDDPTRGSEADVDLFKFETRQGQTLVLETSASQRRSPIDTRIEVLHADGQPVPRLQLQAVRNSAVTFRGIDSITTDCRVENWEEMDLNQLLYLEGEVVKIFRMPQGPDSGFLFYAGSGGKRRAFFDTSATAHALDSPCYVVEPHPVGTKLTPNGLPTFPLFYANDDDGERKLGSDSRLLFTAPSDGTYLVRVSDTRGHGGDRFVYRLSLREAKPDFKVTLNGANPTVPAGSGQSFSVNVERIDGFDGEVKVDITELPPGFTVSTPLLVQAGHAEAKGTLFAAADAPSPSETNSATGKITAAATIAGQTVTRDVGAFGKIKLGAAPKLFVSLGSVDNEKLAPSSNAPPLEITIAPGQTLPASLKIKRNGHEDLVTFFVDNLPHGVIVADIGLNGVLIPKGETEREIFLSAAKWVPETDRLCYAIEQQTGRQTSRPVLLRVRKPMQMGAKQDR